MPSRSQEVADVEMPDAQSSSQNLDTEEDSAQDPYAAYGERPGQRIRVLPGDTPTAASFEFTNEGHTLGNALRHVIMKNPAVEFCGYSIPHPSDPVMNLRIQTYDDVSVYDVLEKGLNDLMDVCDVVTKKFEVERAKFKKSKK